MTIEPTDDRPPSVDTGSPTADPPSLSKPATTPDAPTSAPKVTRARVAKMSGATPRSRSRSAGKEGAPAKGQAKTSASPTAVLKPASALVPVPMATSENDTVRADRVEIAQGGAERVEATTVTVTQGGIGTADARTIDVRQGGIGTASATDIAVSGGSIGFARGERVTLEMGVVGVAVGDEVRVTQSASGYVAARGDATVDQSFVNTLIANRVTIRQPSAVVVLIARQVDGSVRPLLDWRGALAAGAVAGLVMGLLRMGRR